MLLTLCSSILYYTNKYLYVLCKKTHVYLNNLFLILGYVKLLEN